MNKEAIAKKVVQAFYQLLIQHRPKTCSPATKNDNPITQDVSETLPETPEFTEKEL